jgi:DNA-binding winged helix-turn-helix (wHTH) protein/tetratricopeptide (TPR) repeat protein
MAYICHAATASALKPISKRNQFGLNCSMSLQRNGLVHFESYAIDRSRWQLEWQNQPILLNRKTFDLLLHLVDHRDRVVTKEELLQSLWPDQFVEESNLTQHVFLLRKALSRHESGKKIIETVPGRGYRFVAMVNGEGVNDSESGNGTTEDRLVFGASQSITRVTIEQEEADTVYPVVSPIRTGLSRNSSTKRLGWIAAGALALIALFTAGWFGWQHWLDRTAGSPLDVVLTNMDGTTGDPVLDHALVDALRMDLAQSPFVSVVGSARVRATLTQMMQKPDAAITPAMARDLCERTNSQAVMRGTVSRVGQHFLLLEEATSCVNGAVLAEAKEEAGSAEQLPRSIDRLAESLRRKLGESRRSVARFDTPLLAVNTSSLEALKDYSQATREAEVGKAPEAIVLLKSAVAADPSFAAAYFDLAANYASMENFAGERDSIQKAYSARDSATEPIRLAIVALYISVITKDLYAAERNYRSWTELYPRSAQAWNGLAVVQRDLGHHADSLIADQRVLDLRPMNQGMYINLAYAQLRVGAARDAQATCQRAIAKGLDGDRVRETLVEDAYALNDTAQLQTQQAWVAAHPEATFCRIEQIEMAITEGRFRDARRILTQATQMFRQQGLPALADSITRIEGANLMEAGDLVEGKKLFLSEPPDPEDEVNVNGRLLAGDIPGAQAALHTMQEKYPQGTVWNMYIAPYVQAYVAMAAHKPKDAIAALETSRPLEGRDLDHKLLRGAAYLAAGEPEKAAIAYHEIADHREAFALDMDVPLSWLGLGRAYVAEGNRSAAVDAYQHFFKLWEHADPDALFLREAHEEFEKLQAPQTTQTATR